MAQPGVPPDTLPRAPRQIWWVAGLLVALVALLAPILLGKRPAPEPRAIAWPVPRPSATVTPSAPAKPPTATATATATPTQTASPTLTLSPSLVPIAAAPRPRGTAPPREEHYWLARPVSMAHNDAVARTYPYASRLDGTYPVHHGVEFVNAIGTMVQAVADGTIVAAGEDDLQVYGARDGFYGQLIIQRLDRTLYGQEIHVLYAHLSQIDVAVGEAVREGDGIGQVGMTGYAEGPHVHLEVRVGSNDYGRTVNPELWLQPRPGQGTLAGLVLGPDGGPLPEVRLTLYRAEAPTVPYRYLETYPAHQVNPDPAWGENFGTGDLPAGAYELYAYVGNQLYTVRVVVQAGATTWVSLPGGE